jgi:hypothetical protein
MIQVIIPGGWIGIDKCNHAPTNGVGVPTHFENEIGTISELRSPGARHGEHRLRP